MEPDLKNEGEKDRFRLDFPLEMRSHLLKKKGEKSQENQ